MREIGDDYFLSYAGGQQNYDSVYREYSRVDDCLRIFSQEGAPKVSSIAVLGSATGKVLADLTNHFESSVHGCEISPWAYAKTPSKYRRYICLQDMREYLLQVKMQGHRFDLISPIHLSIYLQKKFLPS